jgi:hypothetical protein
MLSHAEELARRAAELQSRTAVFVAKATEAGKKAEELSAMAMEGNSAAA